MLKFVHTADWHLGKAFTGISNEKAKEWNKKIYQAIKRIVDLAIEEQADLFLICGDLFDSTLPRPETVNELEKLLTPLKEKTKIVVIPGNHDFRGNYSIYSSARWSNSFNFIHLLTRENPVKFFDDLDLAICGFFENPEKEKEWLFPPLGWHRNAKFKIGVAHCSLPGACFEDVREMPDELIINSGLNYLALGHWHAHLHRTYSSTPAIYPGSPEVLEREKKDAGYVSLVFLNENREPSFRREKVGQLCFDEVKIDIEELQNEEDLVRRLEKLKDKNRILKVILKGSYHSQIYFDFERLNELFKEDFFLFEIEDSTFKDKLIPDQTLIQIPIVKAYYELMQKKLNEEKDPEKRKVLQEAINYGLGKFRQYRQGREDVYP